MSKRLFLIIALVLLIHFFLRAHNPTALPFFWDEHRHITRAAAIVEGGHPAENSHGKFLLYAWLAPFNPDITAALHVSRTAVALFSLLGVAALFALTRRLFGVGAAFVAVVFYTMAPFSLWYERMVLADSMAAALGMLAAWQSVRLAYHPTYKRAMLMGAMASLAVMAKLTMTFSVVLMPVLAGYLLGSHPEQGQVSWRQWMVARWRHYWWYWFAAGATFVALWVPTLIPATIVATTGEYYVLVDQSLIDKDVSQSINRFAEFYDQILIMLAWPMVVALLAMAGLALWRYPRRTQFLLAWVILIWVPSLILVWRTQTRYLMPGMYPLALMLGGGVVALSQSSARWSRGVWLAAVGLLMVWGAFFALPFAGQASNHVAHITLTRWDKRDYFQAPWNAWALLSAHEYLEANGTRGPDGRVHVLGVYWMCEQMELYEFDGLHRECLANQFKGQIGTTVWQIVVEKATTAEYPLYLILEQHRKTYELPRMAPYPHPDLRWRRVAAYQRPNGGLWVTVWRVDGVNQKHTPLGVNPG